MRLICFRYPCDADWLHSPALPSSAGFRALRITWILSKAAMREVTDVEATTYFGLVSSWASAVGRISGRIENKCWSAPDLYSLGARRFCAYFRKFTDYRRLLFQAYLPNSRA